MSNLPRCTQCNRTHTYPRNNVPSRPLKLVEKGKYAGMCMMCKRKVESRQAPTQRDSIEETRASLMTWQRRARQRKARAGTSTTRIDPDTGAPLVAPAVAYAIARTKEHARIQAVKALQASRSATHHALAA